MSFFGTNIKRIRQVKGLSQKAFADLFDLNRGVISSYEEGRAEPKIETILKVANHFSLDLDKLLSETLESDQLNKVSDTDQLLLFPEFISPKETKTSPEENSSNSIILQKILASIDLVFEFTEEKQLLPQYRYGDVLFLNKADLKKDAIHSLLIYVDENLKYASSATDSESYYKIVGHVSTSEKNIFTEIFERLERLESK